MLTRIAMGAAAGLAATVPQSAAVWGLRAAGVYRRRPAPEVISESVAGAALGTVAIAGPWRTPLMLLQHAGYGAAAGALFGAITGIIRPTVVAGVLTGLVLWKASYDGWIPALRIMPPPEQDEAGRQLTLLVAHIAYGAALGAALDRMTSRT